MAAVRRAITAAPGAPPAPTDLAYCARPMPTPAVRRAARLRPAALPETALTALGAARAGAPGPASTVAAPAVPAARAGSAPRRRHRPAASRAATDRRAATRRSSPCAHWRAPGEPAPARARQRAAPPAPAEPAMRPAAPRAPAAPAATGPPLQSRFEAITPEESGGECYRRGGSIEDLPRYVDEHNDWRWLRGYCGAAGIAFTRQADHGRKGTSDDPVQSRR